MYATTMSETSAFLNPEALAEDLQVLARCRAGNEDAMAIVIAKHRRRLIRIAANVLRDRHEAEDVAQEAFIKGFRQLGRLRDDRAFASFLYRITVRLCMDKLRGRRAQPAIVDSPQASGEREVETKILAHDLLDRLSPDLKMTLVLREMEQLSYEEVAVVMGVPVGTVRSRLHTARERFREMWIQATVEA